MKQLLLFLLIGSFSFAQHIEKITTKNCIPRKGNHIRLKEILEDSRCPEGVTCVWAGQATVVLEVYQDKKLVEEKTLILDSKHAKENLQWVSKYLSEESSKVKQIQLLPYPKDGVNIKPKKRYINLVFQN